MATGLLGWQQPDDHDAMYRHFHSTETAMIAVYNDLLLAADSGQVSALCLLDLTADFDTMDYVRPAVSVGASLWSTRCCPALVPVLLVSLIISSHLFQPDVIHCSRSLFCTSRVGAWSASLYSLHGGPCRSSTAVPGELSRLCRRSPVVSTLPLRRYDVCH